MHVFIWNHIILSRNPLFDSSQGFSSKLLYFPSVGMILARFQAFKDQGNWRFLSAGRTRLWHARVPIRVQRRNQFSCRPEANTDCSLPVSKSCSSTRIPTRPCPGRVGRFSINMKPSALISREWIVPRLQTYSRVQRDFLNILNNPSRQPIKECHSKDDSKRFPSDIAYEKEDIQRRPCGFVYFTKNMLFSMFYFILYSGLMNSMSE